jgi:hypothetical protein
MPSYCYLHHIFKLLKLSLTPTPLGSRSTTSMSSRIICFNYPSTFANRQGLENHLLRAKRKCYTTPFPPGIEEYCASSNRTFCLPCFKLFTATKPCDIHAQGALRVPVVMNHHSFSSLPTPPPTVTINNASEAVSILVLEDIFMTTSHTITHIPKCLRKKSRSIYLSLLKGVVTNPRELEAVGKLIIFPKYVFAFARPSKTTKSANQYHQIKNRLNSFNELTLPIMLQQIKDDISVYSRPSKKENNIRNTWSQNDVNIKKCKRLVGLGRFGDAVKALESSGIHSMCPETYNALSDKHPDGPRLVRGPPADSFTITFCGVLASK